MRAMQRVRVAVQVALLVSFGLCSTAAAQNLSGSGEWWSDAGKSMRGTWQIELRQSGREVTGTLDLKGSNMIQTAEVRGTLAGNEITFGTVRDGAHEVHFAGKLEDGTVQGEWSYAAIDDGGAWSGTLTRSSD